MTKDEYILTQFVSELAEVAHRVTKMMHFGPKEIQPDQPLTNKERLEQEWTDLMAVAEMMEELGYIDLFKVTREDIKAKKARVEKYFRHADENCGTITPEM